MPALAYANLTYGDDSTPVSSRQCNQSLVGVSSEASANATQDVTYISILNDQNSTFIVDMSTPNHIGVSDTDGNSLYLHGAGLHHSTAGCGPSVDILIEDFFSQVEDLSNSTTGGNSTLTARNFLSKRVQPKEFFAIFYLVTQCKRPAMWKDVRRLPCSSP